MLQFKTREEEIAWAAGLFDAEGCTTHSVTTRYHLSSFMKLEMVCFDVVKKFCSILDGASYKVKAYRKNEQPLLRFYGHNVETILRYASVMWDYLSLKKRQQIYDNAVTVGRLHNIQCAFNFSLSVKVPQKTSLAWAAGCFEGDGGCRPTRNDWTRGNSFYSYIRPVVEMKMVDYATVIRFFEFLGLGNCVRKIKGTERSQDTLSWSSRARSTLRYFDLHFRPYFGKKKTADLDETLAACKMKSLYKGPDNGQETL